MHQNKMTDRLGEGNKLSNSEFDGECQKYKYKTKHKQLVKSLEVLGVEKYESEALNKLLEEFYAIVRKKDGEDNERDIFRVLIIAVDRYLTDKEHKNPIVRDSEFKSSNQILGKNVDYFSTRQREAAESVSHDMKKTTTIEENRVIFW